MNAMKTMKWLVKREFWENKGMFFWAPVRLGLALIALLALVMMYTRGHGMDFNGQDPSLTVEHKIEVAKMMANNYLAGAMPLFIMLGFMVFFYCLGAMFEERRDRSILFWKSLPVSDQLTVLSKAAMALILAPLIAIAVGIITSFVLLMMICVGMAFHGIHFFGLLFSNSDFYLAPLRVIGMWPIYVLWAIPTVGWLLMVSAWARSKVFLWAVGLPLLSLIVAKMVDVMFTLNLNIGWFAENVVARILGGLFPGAWTAFNHHANDAMLVQRWQGTDVTGMFIQSWMSLANPSVWIGVIAGAAMIFVAIKLRRWRDED